jgi:phage terminase small subunit
MSRGRPRKPIQQLLDLGIFRGDRHAARLNEPKAAGVPIKPKGMDRIASAFWNRLLPRLLASKIVKEIDTEAVVSACELWALYCKAKRRAMKFPCDKDIRSAVVAYWNAFDKAAARLGMNPVDRAKISVTPEPAPGGIDGFARKRG